MSRDDAFYDFALRQVSDLRRLGYAVCGDWHEADAVVQDALETAYVHWPRILGSGDPALYVRAVLVERCLARSRTAGRAPRVGRRADLAQVLGTLEPQQRAAAVLRYVENRTDTEVAAILRTDERSVEHLCERAVSRLSQLTPPQQRAPRKASGA